MSRYTHAYTSASVLSLILKYKKNIFYSSAYMLPYSRPMQLVATRGARSTLHSYWHIEQSAILMHIVWRCHHRVVFNWCITSSFLSLLCSCYYIPTDFRVSNLLCQLFYFLKAAHVHLHSTFWEQLFTFNAQISWSYHSCFPQIAVIMKKLNAWHNKSEWL